MRIGTKSPLNCVVVQAGWFGLFTPWALVHHHLPVGWEVRLLRHPALPLVHQLSLVSPLDTFMMFYVFLYLLMQIIWTEAPWNIEDANDLLLFIPLMRGLGRHMWGEISSSSWGKETIHFITSTKHQLQNIGQTRASKSCLNFKFKILINPCAQLTISEKNCFMTKP